MSSFHLSVCSSASVCLPAFRPALPACLSVCLIVCLSVCMSVFLSVCLSVCLSFGLSFWPSVYLSVFFIFLSFCPLSVCLSFHPSVCLSVWVSSLDLQVHISFYQLLMSMWGYCGIPFCIDVKLCIDLKVRVKESQGGSRTVIHGAKYTVSRKDIVVIKLIVHISTFSALLRLNTAASIKLTYRALEWTVSSRDFLGDNFRGSHTVNRQLVGVGINETCLPQKSFTTVK
jgi:hypothetical protein